MANRKAGAQGFTLIEVMIVVAVIGILASVAMPTFRGYSARAKVSEAIVLLANCRNQIQEIYTSGGDLPGPDGFGCESTNPSRYVASISTSNEGVVKVTLSSQTGDLRLSLRYITYAPLNGADNVMSDSDLGNPVRRWRCGATADGTDLKAEFLPSSCRGL